MGYFGSKATAGLCQALLAMQPAHGCYIEAFLGGGALMKRKIPALRSIGIDLDEQALAAFRCDYPVELIHGCALEFLASFEYVGDEFTYLDPPYIVETRRSQRAYRYDFELSDHVALLEVAKTLPCKVMISGHPSRLYDEALCGWQRVSFQVTTQAVVRTEVVWFNFGLDQPHWHAYAGRDFSDRQRIKRKMQLWATRYSKLSAGERLALLNAMLAVEVKQLK